MTTRSATLAAIFSSAIFAWLAHAQNPASQPRGGISGKITDKASGGPVSRAVVELTQTQSDDDTPAVTAETGADGAFSLFNLPAGDYFMRVRKDGYLPQHYGQIVWGGRRRRLTVRPGELLNDRDFRLTRQSVIAGTVVNKDGLPMADVAVNAYARRPAPTDSWRPYEGGEWLLKEVSRTTTDDAGRYRLEYLEPGNYYVRVLNEPVSASAPADNTLSLPVPPLPQLRPGEVLAARERPRPVSYGKDEDVYVPQFHPGTSSPVLATAVPLAVPGSEFRGIDFTLRAAKLPTIAGRVLPSADNLPSVVEIGIYPTGFGSHLEDPDSPRVPHAKEIVSARPDGAFQFVSVPPGAYKVIAVGMQGNRRITAIQDISVEPTGATPLILPLQQGLDLRGKVALTGPVPESYRLQSQQLMLQIDDLFPGLSQYFPRFSSSIMTSVGADGTFVLADIAPDAHYNVPMQLLQGALGAYVTARYGGETMPRWIHTRKGETRLELTLEFGTGRVELLIKDGEQPQRDAITALIPSDRNRRQYYQVRQSGSDGKVVFDKVAPGDYDVFAWDDIRDLSWFDPAAMKQFSGRERRIHVGSSGTVSETIQIIAARREVN